MKQEKFLSSGKKDRVDKKSLDLILEEILEQIGALSAGHKPEEAYKNIGQGLLRAGISSFFTLFDKKREQVTVKHFFLPKNVPAAIVSTIKKDIANKRLGIASFPNYKKVTDNKKSLFIEKRTKDFVKLLPVSKEDLKAYPGQNAIILPLLIKGEVFGVLELLSSNLKRQDQKLFSVFGKKLSGKLVKIVMFHETYESEKRYRELFDSGENGYLIYNSINQRYIEANRQIKKFTGYTSEKLRHLDYLLLFTLKERKKIDLFLKDYIKLALTGKTKDKQSLETELITRRGQKKNIILSINKTTEPYDWFLTIRDITEQKRLERELKKSQEKKYQSLYSSMNEGVALHEVIYNKQGRAKDYKIIDVNPAYEQITGISKQKALFKNASKLYGSGEAPYLKEFAEVAKTMKPKKMTVYFEPKKKHFSISLFSPEKGKFATIFQDVTQRIETENNLKLNRKKFQNLVETTSDWIWETNREGVCVYSSPRSKEILGYEPEEIVGKKPFDFMIKSDIKKIGLLFQELASQKKAIENIENVAVHKKGHLVILETNGAPILNNKNELTGYRGINRDISGRKKREEDLRKSEDTLLSVFRAAPTGIGMTVNRDLMWVNEQLCNITGYSKEDLVGKNARIFYTSDSEYKRVGSVKYSQIKKNGTGTVETVWKKKNGSLMNILLSSSAIHHKNPRKGLTFTALDITDRKVAEEALSKLNQNLEKKVKERTKNLQASEQRYKELWNNAPVAYHTLNTKAVITDINNTESKMLGYRKKEMLGRPIFDFVAPEQREDAQRRFLKKLKGEKLAKSPLRTYIRKDGQPVHVLIDDKVEYDNHKKPIAVKTTMLDATKEYFAKIALERNEQMLNGIVESMNDLMIMIDENHTIQWSNSQAKKIMGKQIVGKKCHEVYYNSKNVCVRCLSREAFSDGMFHEKETQIKDKGGNIRDVWSTVNVVASHADGRPKMVIEIMRDITKRKKTENEVKKSTQIRKILNNILKISLKDASTKNILEEALDCLLSVSWMALEGKGGIWLFGESEDKMELFAQRGLDRKTTHEQKTISQGLCSCGKTCQTSKSRGSLENNIALHKDKNGQAHYCIPIVSKDKILGLINIHVAPAYRTNKRDTNFLKAVSNVLASILEINSTKKELKRSERRYRNLINNAEDGVVIITPKANIIFLNNAFARITKQKQVELTGKSFFELIHDKDRDKFKEYFNKELEQNTKKQVFEFRLIDIDKNLKFVGCSGTPTYKNGKINGFQAIIRDMTENKLLQNKIEKSKNHYEQIIDTIGDGICVVDKNYIITGCNRSFANSVGLSFHDIIGKPCESIIKRYNNHSFSGDYCFGTSPDDDNCIIKKAFHTGEGSSLIQKTKNKKNEDVFHRISIFPAKNIRNDIYQVVITIRDVTKIRTAEEKIRKLSEFNTRILDNVPVSIMIIDREGNISSTNAFVKKLSKTQNMVGMNIYELPFYRREGLVPKYKKLLEKGEAFSKTNCRMTNKKGEKKYLNITAVPLRRADGGVEGAISMALDNTETISSRQKVEKLNEELEKKVIQRTWMLDQLNKELAKVLELKTKFISDASHELRTPLTIAQGNLDLAIQEAKNLKKKVPEVYGLVCKEIKQMANILGDLTLLTNADTRNESLAHEDIDINDLIEKASDSLRVLARPKKINLRTHTNKNELIIKGDESRIEKLLINIIRNAIKYTGEKGQIDVQTKTGSSEVKIIVKDNGIGIPEQDLPYIFERFYRVDKARSREEGGTGLGLSICKWIAEAHGGYISVQSQLNKGTEFVVHLPYDHKKAQTDSRLF